MPCRAAISSMSLGRAWVHSLTAKLDQAAAHGIKGIEFFYEDLEYLAREFPGGATAANQLRAAVLIRQWCDVRGITIICLQPFMHYEGLRDRSEHASRIEQMRLWIRLAKVLETDLIAIPSSFLPASQVSEDINLMVEDLREVADMGAREYPPMRFCYEALGWGTRVDTWERSWDIVKRVDRHNFGLCLDTFNIAARIYADPAADSGKTPNADDEVRASMERLVADVDVRRLFMVQLVDAERLARPLREDHEFYNAEQPARMSWSRNCRLFYGEKDEGAYLPAKQIAEAIIHCLKYEGWVSMELFNRCMAYEDPDTPMKLAQRAAVSWKKFVRDLAIEDGDAVPSYQFSEPHHRL
ncbi:xylose isomerase-like protein [Phyllosticta capitalensis]|uniref:xylose isomerase-like protein n=1 Tax=Phyllosticta capitalensis TaxID=121624 RepID=UPI003131BC08